MHQMDMEHDHGLCENLYIEICCTHVTWWTVTCLLSNWCTTKMSLYTDDQIQLSLNCGLSTISRNCEFSFHLTVCIHHKPEKSMKRGIIEIAVSNMFYTLTAMLDH